MNLLSKAQLWELIEYYEIGELDKRLKKNDLKAILKEKLSEKKILSAVKGTPLEMKESVNIFSGLSFDQKKEILEMQQMHDREMA